MSDLFSEILRYQERQLDEAVEMVFKDMDKAVQPYLLEEFGDRVRENTRVALLKVLRDHVNRGNLHSDALGVCLSYRASLTPPHGVGIEVVYKNKRGPKAIRELARMVMKPGDWPDSGEPS